MSRVGTEKKIEFLKENGLCVMKFCMASFVNMDCCTGESPFWEGLDLSYSSSFSLTSSIFFCYGYYFKWEPIPWLGEFPPFAPSDDMEKDDST